MHRIRLMPCKLRADTLTRIILQQAEHAHRLEMDRMEREMELKLMERLRTQHEEKWQRKEADEIKRFDAERISSKLLQTLSKTARPKSARARLRGS